MIDPDLLAEHFPDRPTAAYLDTAAIGLVPAAVRDAVDTVARALAGGTTGSADWHPATDRAPELLATDLGVDAERISVLANTSEACNAVARAIPLSPGDEVLTFADDFPSPRLPWTTIDGFHVREIEPGAGDDRTGALLKAIDERTSVVSVTHVHASTGTVIDLVRVAAACRDAGALLVIDGAQGAGVLPGAAAHADVYIGAAYKWLLAGFGAAVVATSEHFDAQARPGLVGYMNMPPSAGLVMGHANLFGLAALQAAADVRHGIGVEAIRTHTRTLVERVRAGASELGLPSVGSSATAGIVSLEVTDARALAERLRDRDVVVAVRGGLLRVSPYLTTTDADVDRLLTALADLAPDHRPADPTSGA